FHHCRDDARINLLFLVGYIPIFKNQLKTSLFRVFPDRVVRWRSRTEEDRTSDLGRVLPCHKFMKAAKAHTVADIEDAIIHRIVDIHGKPLLYRANALSLDV